MEDTKTINEHARAMYTDTRETLRKSMDRIAAAVPITKKDESRDYINARTVRESVEKIQAEPTEGDIGDLEAALAEAVDLKKTLMEQRAKCVSSGFPMAAKVFTESIEKVSKIISRYERKKNLGV